MLGVVTASNIGRELTLMNGFRTAFASALVVSVACASTLAAQVKHPWATFKPGDWVEIKSTTVMGATGKQQTSVVTTKTTLLEKSAEKVVLENAMTVSGETTKAKFDLPVKGYTEPGTAGMTVMKTGRETLVIAGKSVTCETLEASMNVGGTLFLFKRWTSSQVPGLVVKTITTSKDSQSTAEVVDFKGN